jgi:pilus assembly protein FimV
VRLAHPNVYRGANIGMPAVLSTLRMSVMRRDGRQFLHITSLGPVESEHLHLYLELADGSQRSVRLATLWLTPDPNPVPAPAPVVAPVPARAVEPEVKPAPKPEAVQPIPARPKQVSVQRKDVEPVVRKPVPVPAPAPAGGACAPQPRQQVDACVVLGAKNAMLHEQLGQLEDKVRVLQVAAGAAPASAVQAVKVHKPKKKKPEPPPEPGTPWLLVGAGAGVLALLAGLVFVLRRRRAAQRKDSPRVGLGARLKARLQRKAAPAAALEPTLERGAHESSTQV